MVSEPRGTHTPPTRCSTARPRGSRPGPRQSWGTASARSAAAVTPPTAYFVALARSRVDRCRRARRHRRGTAAPGRSRGRSCGSRAASLGAAQHTWDPDRPCFLPEPVREAEPLTWCPVSAPFMKSLHVESEGGGTSVLVNPGNDLCAEFYLPFARELARLGIESTLLTLPVTTDSPRCPRRPGKRTWAGSRGSWSGSTSRSSWSDTPWAASWRWWWPTPVETPAAGTGPVRAGGSALAAVGSSAFARYQAGGGAGSEGCVRELLGPAAIELTPPTTIRRSTSSSIWR